MDQILRTVIGLADAIGVEGVGREDVRPGVDIAVANRADHLRLRQVHEVVIALLLLREIGARGIVLCRKSRALDGGPVGAVLDQDLLRSGSFELFAFGHAATFGRRPSIWQIA